MSQKAIDARRTLESFVARLAYEMVAADKGTRALPFKSMSTHTPSKLFALEPAETAAEVIALVAKIKKDKPSPPLRSICRVCEKQAKALQRALKTS